MLPYHPPRPHSRRDKPCERHPRPRGTISSSSVGQREEQEQEVEEPSRIKRPSRGQWRNRREQVEEGKTSRSRRIKQRHARRQRRKEEEPRRRQVEWEKARFLQQCSQLERAIEKIVRDHYGFLPDLSLSDHMNARRVLGNTSPRHYFSKPSNLAYHDLAPEYIQVLLLRPTSLDYQ